MEGAPVCVSPMTNYAKKKVDIIGKVFGQLCAVVVTYNVGWKYRGHFESIISQVNKIFIIDNGSDQETVSLLIKLAKENPGRVQVIFNETNLGVAKAQNIGLSHALEQEFGWVLLLDHDSSAHLDMIYNMGRALDNYPEREQVGLIAPYIKEINVEREPRYIVPRHKLLFRKKRFGGSGVIDDVLCVMASGSLIRMDTIRKLGKFREEFFIDYIDSEFCMALISRGWKILAVRDAVLEHSLGNMRLHDFLGLEIITSNHSAERRYTIYRNRVYVWKKYLFTIPSYVVFDIAAASYDLLRILIFEKDARKKLAQAMRGALMGLVDTDWCNSRF